MNQLVCEEHNNPFTQVQINSERAKLICEECLFEKLDQKNQVENIIYLKKAASSVGYFMSKTNIRDSFPNLIDQICKFDDNELKKQQTLFEKKIKGIQNQLDAFLLEIKAYIQFLVQTRKEILTEFNKALKFERFELLYKNLEQQIDDQIPDIIHQIETQFYQYYQSIQNNQKTVYQDLIEILRKHSAKIQKSPYIQTPKLPLNNLIEDLNQIYVTFFNSSKPLQGQSGFGNIADSTLLSFDYMCKLYSVLKERTNKKVQQGNLIYKGTRDGLNANAFWERIYDKQNLLMIFKQKQTNQIFGGYSPCRWYSTTQVQDDTLSSFLFSQTNNQIYPLNQECKQYAIYCKNDYGPIFGGGHDLNISGNFQSGYSNLGHSYQLDQSLMNQKATILFGATTPNIEECEIYEIVFSQ